MRRCCARREVSYRPSVHILLLLLQVVVMQWRSVDGKEVMPIRIDELVMKKTMMMMIIMVIMVGRGWNYCDYGLTNYRCSF